jgi:hypothetical protein
VCLILFSFLVNYLKWELYIIKYIHRVRSPGPGTMFPYATQTINYIGEVSCIPVTYLHRTEVQIKTKRYKLRRYRVFHILCMGGRGGKDGWSVVCGIGLPAVTHRDARQTVYKSQSDPSVRRTQHTNWERHGGIRTRGRLKWERNEKEYWISLSVHIVSFSFLCSLPVERASKFDWLK